MRCTIASVTGCLLIAGCSHSSHYREVTGMTPDANTAQTALPKDPAIICHRGLHHDWPENSREAMQAGWAAGFEWCECDVYLSSDDVVFLLHDAKLDRTTEAKGNAAERPWAELRQIRLRKADGTLTDCRIPSLEETLAVMPPHRGIVIEVKGTDNERLVREVLRIAQGRKYVFQSFNGPNVRHAQRLDPAIPTAFLVGKPEVLEQALNDDWRNLNIDFKLVDEQVMQQAREAGKSVGIWTANEPADIQRMLGLGVERIISDHPERVRDALR